MSTAVVTELSPKTEYSLTLYAAYPNLIGNSETITVKTSEGCTSAYIYPFKAFIVFIITLLYCCSLRNALLSSALLPKVSNFRIIEEGLFSLRLGWTPPLGKLNGFKIFIPRCKLTVSMIGFTDCIATVLLQQCLANIPNWNRFYF